MQPSRTRAGRTEVTRRSAIAPAAQTTAMADIARVDGSGTADGARPRTPIVKPFQYSSVKLVQVIEVKVP